MIQWIDGEPVRRQGKDSMSLVVFPLAELLQQVAAEFGVTTKALKSRRRERPLTAIRAAFCRRAYALQSYSLNQIGHPIGLDHSSVLYLLGRRAQKPPQWLEDYLAQHQAQ